MDKKFDLEERLIDFASVIIDISEGLPKTRAGEHIGGQLLRSGTSPALHYGEAQAAESPADFIHKMKVCLKELRKTSNCLRLINKRNWVSDRLTVVLKESNEFVAIFITGVATAQRNTRRDKGKPGERQNK